MRIKIFFVASLILHLLVFYVSTLKLNIIKKDDIDTSYIQIQEAPPPPPPLKVKDVKTFAANTESEPAQVSNKTSVQTNNQDQTNKAADTKANAGVEGGVEGGVPGGVVGGVLGASLTNYVPFYLVEELPQPLSPIEVPPYPEEARRLGIEGKVVMQIYIDDKGIVRNVEVSKSPDEKLSEASKKAIYNAKFKPARLNGMARAVSMQMVFRFKLE